MSVGIRQSANKTTHIVQVQVKTFPGSLQAETVFFFTDRKLPRPENVSRQFANGDMFLQTESCLDMKTFPGSLQTERCFYRPKVASTWKRFPAVWNGDVFTDQRLPRPENLSRQLPNGDMFLQTESCLDLKMFSGCLKRRYIFTDGKLPRPENVSRQIANGL